MEVEKAKSDRSRCSKCGKKIPKNSIRINYPHEIYATPRYLCKKCGKTRLMDELIGAAKTLAELEA